MRLKILWDDSPTYNVYPSNIKLPYTRVIINIILYQRYASRPMLNMENSNK